MLSTLLAMATHAQAPRHGHEDRCSRLLPPEFDQGANQPRQGRYDNPAYGYSVRIPNGLTGYVPARGPERGFGIVLSVSPRAALRVDAGYDAFYDITAPVVHRRDLNGWSLHDRVLNDRADMSKLHHEPADRFVTRLQCGDDPQIYVHEAVIVLRDREIYRVDLLTVPERYAGDVKLLEAMLRSWHWLPIKPAS